MKPGKKSLLSVKYLDLLAGAGLSAQDLPEGLKGKPVHIPQVNFKTPLDQRVRAKAGPPPYAVRAKLVEDLTEELYQDLREQWAEIGRDLDGRPEQFARVWRAVAESVKLGELNHLIKEHNTFYPIEANLQPDPETGRYMIGATPWKPKPAINVESLLQLFPPELNQARAASRR